MLFALRGWATMTIGTPDCPVQFEGRVKEIIAPVGPTDIFSTNRVIFENQRTLKGEADEQVILEVLQNGPFKLAPEKDYRVQVRNGKLCWLDEL
jgi:hypothetical protein